MFIEEVSGSLTEKELADLVRVSGYQIFNVFGELLTPEHIESTPYTYYTHKGLDKCLVVYNEDIFKNSSMPQNSIINAITSGYIHYRNDSECYPAFKHPVTGLKWIHLISSTTQLNM